MKHLLSLLLLGSLLYGAQARAQASFNNPSGQPANAYAIDSKRIDDPGSPVVIRQGAAQSKSFEITVWRSAGTAAAGTIMLQYGTSPTNLANTALKSLNVSNSGWTPDATTGNAYDRLSFSGNVSLSAADAGTYTAIYAVYYQGNSRTSTEVSHPVYIQVQSSSPSGTSSGGFALSQEQKFFVGEAGTTKQFSLNGSGLNTVQSVVFNGQNLPFTATASNILCSPLTMPPKGDYTISVVSGSATVTKPVHVVTPLAQFFPCGSLGSSPEICADQCVSPGATPAPLMGRVLATSSDEYDDYNNTNWWENDASNKNRFGSPDERERVQWEYSLDGYSWYSVWNGNDRNYQPGPVTRTTYFRRVSTHAEGWFNHRAYWYTSAVVRISAQGNVPTPVASTYGFANCGNTGKTLDVAVTADPANKSLNWWVPYPGWTVDGYSTYANNSSYTTTATQVALAIPANTPPGVYTIAVSGNGDCGGHSQDATITVNVDQNPPAAPAPGDISFHPNDNTTQCNWYYDARCALVPGADTYYATASTGNSAAGQLISVDGYVTFPLNIYGGSYVTVTVTATNSCGTGQAGSASQYLDQANPQCDYQYLTLYPNPTTDHVNLRHGGQAGQATFYNAQGTACKSVPLRAGQAETDVNLLDLPTGTYHVRVKASGKISFDKQLVITH